MSSEIIGLWNARPDRQVKRGAHEWGITVHFSVMTRLCSAFNGEREWHNRRSKAVNAFLWGMDDFVWNVSSLSSATDVLSSLVITSKEIVDQ